MIHDKTNMNPSLEISNTSHRLIASDSNATLCHSDKDHGLVTPDTFAVKNPHSFFFEDSRQGFYLTQCPSWFMDI